MTSLMSLQICKLYPASIHPCKLISCWKNHHLPFPQADPQGQAPSSSLDGGKVSPSALITSTHAALLEEAMRVAPPLDEQQMTAPTGSSSSVGGNSSTVVSNTVYGVKLKSEAAKFRRRMSHFKEWTPSKGKKLVDPANDELSYAEASELSGQKRILQQFKGCVRSFFE